MKPCTEFDIQYLDLIKKCYACEEETLKRNGVKYKSIGAVNLEFKGLPLLTLRDIDIKFSIAEIIWHMSGSKSNLLEHFGYTVWSKFQNRMAYGGYWRGKRCNNEFDQLTGIIKKLSYDPSFRGCVLNSWPNKLQPQNPCIVSVAYSIIRNGLDMVILQRSADVYFGLPHDIASFSIMWFLLAACLKIETGKCNWTISNAHIYENQYENILSMVSEGYKRKGETTNFNLIVDDLDIERAIHGKESLVHDIYHQLQPIYAKIKGPKLPKIDLVW